MKIRKEYCQWHEVVETPAECSMKPTCEPAAHTSTLLATFDKFCRSDMEQKDNVVAMRLEIVRAVNAHEELLGIVKRLSRFDGCYEYYEGNPHEPMDFTDYRLNVKALVEKARKAIAKAEGK